jgi:hypothetical protein
VDHWLKRFKDKALQGINLHFKLNVAVKMWPTPNVPNGGRTTWHAESSGRSYYHKGKKVQFGLEQAVRMWPTPNASDGNKGQTCLPVKGQIHLGGAVGGQLNPTWVEWLMGFPLGWTDCGVSATPSCRKSPVGLCGES